MTCTTISAVHIVRSSRHNTHRKTDQAEITCFHQYMSLLSRNWRLTDWLAHDCELCEGGVEDVCGFEEVAASGAQLNKTIEAVSSCLGTREGGREESVGV
jgi:hypothetical protein